MAVGGGDKETMMVTKRVLTRRRTAKVPGMSQADPNDPCLDWLQVYTQCVCVCV